jgi:D-glycero-D-manno-heptose 1,7-bisphosphate phosphatase
MSAGRRAVFLDRDGVLNRAEVRDGKPYAPRRLEEFRLLPGTAAALRGLREARLFLVVITNQPDIANGLVGEAVVAAMHERLRKRLPIDDIKLCPHGQSAGCDCRKPKPGMLMAAARQHAIDLSASFMVGDRVSDMLAGQAAGCYTIFLQRGYEETRRQSIEADTVAYSLPGAARLILSRLQGGL